jgi:hypothetical protein
MAGYELDMNDFNNNLDSILAKNNLPDDSIGINQSIESTKDELRAAIMNGQSEKMIELDNRLRVLSARQFGASVSETKNLIDKAELEKISIAKELERLRDIKKQKNIAARRTEELLRARMLKVQAAEFDIQISESRLESARVLSRESKDKLQKLLNEKQQEVTNQRERYEISRY